MDRKRALWPSSAGSRIERTGRRARRCKREEAVVERSDGDGAYVALLRAVNVGGHAKISMESLRSVFSRLGFGEVRTVIQSGNVVFTSDEPPEVDEIERAIERRSGLAVAVLLRTSREFREVCSTVPFDAVEPDSVHIGFLRDRVERDLLESIDAARFAPERAVALGREVYFSLPEGMGRAKLPQAVERKLARPMTIRNRSSVDRLNALLHH